MKSEYQTYFPTSPRLTPAKYMKKYEQIIDRVQMARDLQFTIENMAEQGWELYNYTPISTKYYQTTYTGSYTHNFRKTLVE